MRTKEQEIAAYNGMKTSAVAKDLDCTPDHVVKLIKCGALKAVNIGSASRPEYRVSRKSFEAFLSDRAVEPRR